VPSVDRATETIPPCPVCGSPTHPRFALCFCCHATARQLQLPLTPVAAMTEYRLGDALHGHLRGYKDAALPEARRVHTAHLVALLRSWMAADLTRLTRRFGSGWDVVATVPSSRRPGTAPMDTVVTALPELGRHAVLLVRGPDATDHLVAARRGFEPADGVDRHWLRRQRVLVVDDTVITGSRAQSAAAALRIHGAHVVGILALGRVVGGAGSG
jgi:predicted amidophosphoribosyltransferase